MRVSIRQEIQQEIKSKVNAYVKIITGQSTIKQAPNGININSIIEVYTKINTNHFMIDYKLPRVSAKRYAKLFTTEFVNQCVKDCNY